MINPVKSRVLEKMRAGQKTISYKCNLSCPRAVEIAAMSGFDAVWICQEHVPTDQMTMETQILAAKAYGSDCIVRVAKGSYSDYIRPLEADASGIMIPHLMSYEEAKEIVNTVRFQPLGRRPVDGGNADGLFCKFDFKEYIKFTNKLAISLISFTNLSYFTPSRNFSNKLRTLSLTSTSMLVLEVLLVMKNALPLGLVIIVSCSFSLILPAFS